MNSPIDIYKVVVLGEGKSIDILGRVGKTSMSLRYVQSSFNDNQTSTINAVYLEKVQKLDNGKSVKLAIWDTAGQQKYNAIAPVYYRDAVGAIIVYQINSTQSFEKVKKWIQELKEYAPKDIVMVVCGNKCDLQTHRKVDHKYADKYAKEHGASHFLVSAKSGAGIQEAFLDFAERIYQAKNSSTVITTNRRNLRTRISNQPKTDPQKKQKCC